jgi:hypothetical protein
LKAQLGDIPVLALTATATRRVALDIVRQLGMRKPAGYKGSFFRPNLRIIVQKKGNGRNTRADILSVVRGHRGETGIVYAATRRDVESLTDWLTQHGVNALPYHAGLDDRTRAGRDGLPSDCITFFSWADVIAYERFLQDMADPQLRAETHQRTVGLFRLLDSVKCRHQALCGYFDEPIEPCGEACDVCLGLSLDHVAPKKRTSASTPRLPSSPIAVSQAEAERFEALRALRRELADAERVPPYVVFSDAVLRELARRVPKTGQELVERVDAPDRRVARVPVDDVVHRAGWGLLVDPHLRLFGVGPLVEEADVSAAIGVLGGGLVEGVARPELFFRDRLRELADRVGRLARETPHLADEGRAVEASRRVAAPDVGNAHERLGLVDHVGSRHRRGSVGTGGVNRGSFDLLCLLEQRGALRQRARGSRGRLLQT